MSPSRDTRKRGRSKHHTEYRQAKRALQRWGERTIDRRTSQGKALSAWRDALVQDLGGEDQVSAQQLTVIDLAARTKILLDGIDAYLFQEPGAHEGASRLFSKRERKLYPIVRQRQALADSLARYMSMLGLERRSKVYDLADYVVETYGDGEAAEG
jgi:hypothetical protein